MLYAGEIKGILMLLCDITISKRNHNSWRDLNQILSGLFETFGSMSEISFLVIACHKNNFTTAVIT